MLQPRPSHASPPPFGYDFDSCSPFASLALVQLAGELSVRDRLQRCLQRLKALRKVR
ncbi:hypothetical protein FQZ97_574720 [compost metagenome]